MVKDLDVGGKLKINKIWYDWLSIYEDFSIMALKL